MDSEQCQGFQVEHNIGKAFMMLRETFRVFRLFFSTWLQDKLSENWKWSHNNTCIFSHWSKQYCNYKLRNFFNLYTERGSVCRGLGTNFSVCRTFQSTRSLQHLCFCICGWLLIVSSGWYLVQSLVLMLAPIGIHGARFCGVGVALYHCMCLS